MQGQFLASIHEFLSIMYAAACSTAAGEMWSFVHVFMNHEWQKTVKRKQSPKSWRWWRKDRGPGSSPYFKLKLKDFQPNLKYIRGAKSTGAPALQNLDSCWGLSVWEDNDQQNDGKTSSLSENRITSDSRWGTLLHSIQFSWFQCQKPCINGTIICLQHKDKRINSIEL